MNLYLYMYLCFIAVIFGITVSIVIIVILAILVVITIIVIVFLIAICTSSQETLLSSVVVVHSSNFPRATARAGAWPSQSLNEESQGRNTGSEEMDTSVR